MNSSDLIRAMAQAASDAWLAGYESARSMTAARPDAGKMGTDDHCSAAPSSPISMTLTPERVREIVKAQCDAYCDSTSLCMEDVMESAINQALSECGKALEVPA